MDDMTVHQIMGEALVSRGLMSTTDVAVSKASLEARLAGLHEPGEPEVPVANTPAPKGSTATQPGAATAADFRDQPGPVDPLDALAFQGARGSHEYNFGIAPHGVEISLEQDIQVRNMFLQHEIPAAVGSQIGRLWNQAIVNPPDEARLEQGRQECASALHKMWGRETENNLAVAQREVQRMAKTNPEIVEMLEVSGLGNSPWLASTLYHLARARGRA